MKPSPWPTQTPLDPALVEAALWHAKGNVHRAATLLGTETARLAHLLARDEELAQTREKAAGLLIDRAEGVLQNSLDNPDQSLETAKWVLSNGGKARGWGKEAPVSIGFGTTAAQGAIAIKWQVDGPTDHG